MNRIWMKIFLMLPGLIGAASAQAAVDSYRFAHVTIATPWYIFMFVLMAVLAWRNAVRKSERDAEDAGH